MAKINHLTAERNRFSEWQFLDGRELNWKPVDKTPVHLQHRLICCDCGLAHDFEFVVVETMVRNGRLVNKRVANKHHGVQYRVRRNERATVRVRKTPQVCTPKKRRK